MLKNTKSKRTLSWSGTMQIIANTSLINFRMLSVMNGLSENILKNFNPTLYKRTSLHWHIKKYAHEKKMITLHSYQKIARTSVSVLNDFSS